MTLYQFIGFAGQAMIILVPVFILIIRQNVITEASVSALLCLGAALCFDFRLYGFSLMQILLVLIVFFGLTKENSSGLIIENDFKSSVLFYTVYFTLVTLIGYFCRSSYKVEGSIIQNELRPIVQSVQMICLFIAVIIVSKFNGEISLKILNSFHKALLFFAILGIVQVFLYAIVGFDILPMRKDFISEINGLSVTAENGILRATAGMGEPKQYAKFMVLGLAIELLLYKIIGNKGVKWKNVILFGLATYFSSSTTGFLIAFVVLIIYVFKRIKRNAAYVLVAVIVLGVMIPLVLKSDVVIDKFEGAEKRGEIVGLEDSDTATVLWLKNEPQYIIFGTGISNTVAYANEYALDSSLFINRYPYTLRRGIVKTLAEGGIIGLILQLGVILKLYKRFKYNSDLKYFGFFIIIMHFFLTCEAIIEVQMILLALLGGIGNNYKFGEKNEGVTDKHGLPTRQYRKNSFGNS